MKTALQYAQSVRSRVLFSTRYRAYTLQGISFTAERFGSHVQCCYDPTEVRRNVVRIATTEAVIFRFTTSNRSSTECPKVNMGYASPSPCYTDAYHFCQSIRVTGG